MIAARLKNQPCRFPYARVLAVSLFQKNQHYTACEKDYDEHNDRNDDPTVFFLNLKSVSRCISCLIGHHYPVFSCLCQHFAERVFHLHIVSIHLYCRFFRQIGKRYAVLRCTLILHAFKFQRWVRRIHCNCK